MSVANVLGKRIVVKQTRHFEMLDGGYCGVSAELEESRSQQTES